jgi:beta-1,4-mannosyltransferase
VVHTSRTPQNRLCVAVNVPWNSEAMNPYIQRLYQLMSDAGIIMCRGREFRMRPQILHLHWPELCMGPTSPLAAARKGLRSLLKYLLHKLAGTRIVWTAHNLHTHERRHPILERAFWALFIPLVDCAIHLTHPGMEDALGYFPVLRNKTNLVIPHGDFREDYPTMPSQRHARARYGIREDADVTLLFGNIRRYKNVHELLDVHLRNDDVNHTLIVAGSPIDERYTTHIRDLAKGSARTILRTEFVPAAEVPWLFAAATRVALPYTSIHNSGSALLALSFGRVVVAPAIPHMVWLARQVGGEWVQCYKPPLTFAALRTQPPRTASPDLSHFSWATIARQTIDAYAAVIAGNPRRRIWRHVNPSMMERIRGV